MKKVLTIAAAALSALAMNAETIWEGNVNTGSWGNEPGKNCIQIGSAAFATASEGDKIVVTVSEVAAGTEFPKYILKNGSGWADLPGASTVDATKPGDYTTELEAEAVTIIKANGMVIQGDGVTLTKVELKTSASFEYITLWEGNGALAWDYTDAMPKVQNNGDLALIKEGDVIRFTISQFSQVREDWPKVCVRDLMDKDIATLELWDFIGSPLPMEQSIVVENPDDWKNGIYCVGPAGTTVTKVELGVKAGGSVNTGEIVIWEGEPTLLTWGNQLGQTSATKAGRLSAGDELVITVTSLEASEEWPKAACKDNNWYDIFNVELWGYRDGTFPVDAVYKLTDADVAAMKDGFFFAGVGATVSRIVVRTTSAVSGITAGESDTVSVYSISGVRVRTNVEPSDATAGLPAGLYIVGGKKVLVK